MPDNRSLWSDGPSEDDHHGWLDPEPDPSEPRAGERRPAGHHEPTRPHHAERLGSPAAVPPQAPPRHAQPAPPHGPPTSSRARGCFVVPLAALCAVAILFSGVLIGTRLVGDNTVERTVVAGGSGGAATASQIKAAYEATHEGVVLIRAGSASGTGWVYDDQGTIVTNNHVISDAKDDVRVRFKDDGSFVRARTLGTDISSDLAVLRVDPKDVDKLVPLKVAESDDVETGDPVVAIGYPLGLDQTTTAGIISGVGRSIQAQNRFSIDKVLQTDAPINQGNSGGPLLNVKGEVVGVNSQIATTSAGGGSVGIGFAIPSDKVRDIVPTLEKGQSVRYGYLGVSVSDSRDGDGALVAETRPGSPAARANLRPNSRTALAGISGPDGDVITKIDGQGVSRPDDVTRVVNEHRPGDRITLGVRRGGADRDVEVTLGDREAAGGASGPTGTLTIPTNPSNPSNPSIP